MRSPQKDWIPRSGFRTLTARQTSTHRHSTSPTPRPAQMIWWWGDRFCESDGWRVCLVKNHSSRRDHSSCTAASAARCRRFADSPHSHRQRGLLLLFDQDVCKLSSYQPPILVFVSETSTGIRPRWRAGFWYSTDPCVSEARPPGSPTEHLGWGGAVREG